MVDGSKVKKKVAQSMLAPEKNSPTSNTTNSATYRTPTQRNTQDPVRYVPQGNVKVLQKWFLGCQTVNVYV